MSGKMNQKRSETLIKKVDTNTEFLISRLTNIIALSASTSSQEIQASEMLQIEYNASMIVRLVEELLSVTRTLKENWILGQLPKSNDEDHIDITLGVQDKMNEVLKRILQTKRFDEEVGEDDASEDDEAEEDEDEEEDDEEIQPEVIIPEVTPHIKEEVSMALDSLVPDVDSQSSLSAQIKEEQPTVPNMKLESATPIPQSQQHTQPDSEKSTQPVQDVSNSQPEVTEQPIMIPDTIDMIDTGNVLGDYDFDNFGAMDDQDNDIIMID